MTLGIATVSAITVIAFIFGQIIKSTPIDNKWIPIVCGISGAILGIIAYYCGMPDFPAVDPVTAAAIGVTSGLAATGVHQAYTQLSSDDGNDENGI